MSAVAALAGWDNFYVIVGSAAAGLTGLTFVVIALVSDAGMGHPTGTSTFVTPTVIHFTSALWIAALAAIPRHSALSLGLLMLASGITGALYSLRTLLRMHRMDRRDYAPVIEDWLWNGILPLAVYALLAAGGALMLAAASLFALAPATAQAIAATAGYLIGSSALLLLVIGIHNVWDLAVWITVERPERRRQREAAGRGAPEQGRGHESGHGHEH
jgi:hypothetical protein